MKQFLQGLLRRMGREIVPASRSRLLQDLTGARNVLNHAPALHRSPHEQLGHAALGCQLEWLLAHYRINLVLDVGANEGQFARELRELGYRGRIASFEPMAACVAVLEKLAAGDPLWSIHPFGLGREAGRRELTRFADASFSSLHAPSAAAQTEFGRLVEPVARETVEVRTLDAIWPGLIASEASPRVLLKTDTQGHDLEVLRGGEPRLNECSVVVCEISFTPLYQGAPAYRDVVDFLEAHRFECAGVHPLCFRADRPSLIEANAVFINPQAAVPPSGDSPGAS